MASGWRCDCGSSWGPHINRCEDCRPGNVSAPTPPAPAVPLVSELWITWWKMVGSKLPSRKTASAQGNVLRRLKLTLEDGRELTVFDLPWNEVTPLVADLYRNLRTSEPSRRKDRNGEPAHISGSTVNRELTTLQSMFTYHRDVRRAIAYNPLDGFQHTDETGGTRLTSLTPEEMKTFLSFAHPMFQDLMWTAYRCVGMRKSEVQHLRKSEVDWTARVIHLPAARNKNRRPRTIPFPDDVERILRRHSELSRGPYVFVRPKDPKRVEPVTDSAMWYWLNQARKASGMKGFDDEPIVFHTARHSGVTGVVESGGSESFTMAAAGMTPKTFSRYVKFGPRQQDMLREVLNRAVTEPTPIAGELEDARRPPGRAVGPQLVKSADSE
jgi:integrase